MDTLSAYVKKPSNTNETNSTNGYSKGQMLEAPRRAGLLMFTTHSTCVKVCLRTHRRLKTDRPL